MPPRGPLRALSALPARVAAPGLLLTALAGCFGKTEVGGADATAAPEADAAAAREASTPDAAGDASHEPEPVAWPPPEPPEPTPAPPEPCPEEGAVVLVEGRPSALLVDDEHVYFAERGPGGCARNWCAHSEGGRLYRVPRCGGQAEVVVDARLLVGQLVDGGDVVYALLQDRLEYIWNGERIIPAPEHPVPTAVLRIRKSTGRLTRLPLCARHGAAAGGHLYYSDPCGGRVARIAHDSDSPVTVETVNPAPAKVAATETQLFYVKQAAPAFIRVGPEPTDELVEHDLTDGTTTRIPYPSRGHVTGLAATSARVFIADTAVSFHDASSSFGIARSFYYFDDGDLLVRERGEQVLEQVLALHGDAPLRLDGDLLYLKTDGAVHPLEGYDAEEPLLAAPGFDYAVHGGRIYWAEDGRVRSKPVR